MGFIPRGGEQKPGPRGPRGPKGDEGPEGRQGVGGVAIGEKGDKGDPGIPGVGVQEVFVQVAAPAQGTTPWMWAQLDVDGPTGNVQFLKAYHP